MTASGGTAEDRLAALERRLQQVEDERAIERLLTGYGLGVDTGDTEATMALFADDCVIDIDGTVAMQGREQTRNIVESPIHQSLLPRCAHVMGPFVVEVDGDTAVATGYATVYLREGEDSRVWRQSFGRWELARIDGRWQVRHRFSRSLGREDAAALVAPALRDRH